MPRGSSSHVRRFCITPDPPEGGGLVNHARGETREAGRAARGAGRQLALHLFSSLIASRSSHSSRLVDSSRQIPHPSNRFYVLERSFKGSLDPSDSQLTTPVLLRPPRFRFLSYVYITKRSLGAINVNKAKRTKRGRKERIVRTGERRSPLATLLSVKLDPVLRTA